MPFGCRDNDRFNSEAHPEGSRSAAHAPVACADLAFNSQSAAGASVGRRAPFAKREHGVGRSQTGAKQAENKLDSSPDQLSRVDPSSGRMIPGARHSTDMIQTSSTDENWPSLRVARVIENHFSFGGSLRSVQAAVPHVEAAVPWRSAKRSRPVPEALPARQSFKIEAGRHGPPAERLTTTAARAWRGVHDDISYNTPRRSTSSAESWHVLRGTANQPG